MKRLVILGGGTAGTAVANRLRAALPERELQITVVDQDDAHHYQPGYLFRAFGTYKDKQIVRPRRPIFAKGINLILSPIEKVDPVQKKVELADGHVLPYDILIIATGVTPRPDRTPGMDGPELGKSVHEFYTLAGATKLYDALQHFTGGRLVVHITEMPIKCPVAPLEFTFLADAWLTDHGLRDKTSVTFVTPLDGAFTKPVASRELGHLLAERNIDVVTDFAIAEVDDAAKQIVSYDDRRVDFDLLVTIPLNMGADYVERSGMGDDLNLVPCDPHTMTARDYPDVYVLGDAGTLPTSKAGAVAHFSIDIFMHNFLAQWHGKPADRQFDGHANCFVETGHGKAMLLDFNYETQPVTGVFPFPVIGPLKLLRESRLNHLGKLGFAWVYWNLLVAGRPIPLPANMMKAGKNLKQQEETGTAPAQPAVAGANGPAAGQTGAGGQPPAPSDQEAETSAPQPIVPTF